MQNLQLRVLQVYLLLLSLSARRSTSSVINLWPGKAPNETDPIGKEIEKQDGTQVGCGILRNKNCNLIYNVSVPTITPYLVYNGTGTAIVVAPGGGYTILAIDKEGRDVARMYNSIGVSVFLLKYRVPARAPKIGLPKWWAALQDAQRAVSLVRSGAVNGKWGNAVNASRIGFSGFSAGGHLTGHVSSSKIRAYSRVDSADDFETIPDFSIFGYPWMLLPNNKAPKWGEVYSLANEFSSLDKDHPLSFFFHNEDDPVAPPAGTLIYYSKLLSLGAKKSSLHMSPKGGHGFGLCQNGFSKYEEICDWPKQVQRFLQVNNLTIGDPVVEKGRPPKIHNMLTQNCKDEGRFHIDEKFSIERLDN
jgi:acetyl esterase/lipase